MALKFFSRFYIGLVAAIVLGCTVQAQNVEVNDSHSRLSIISEVASVREGQVFWLAAQFEPLEGWHTYWINPGDSGAAPIFAWDASQNTQYEDPLFPVPSPLPVGPLLNYGYKGPSTLLIKAQAPATFSGTELTVSGEVEWLVCEIECIPQFGTFSFDLPVGAGDKAESVKSLFQNARAALPELSYWDSELKVAEKESRLIVYMDRSEATLVKAARFYPLSEDVTDYAAQQSLRVIEEGLEITLPRFDDSALPESGNGIITLTDEIGTVTAYNLEGPVVRETMTSAPTSPPLPLWQAAFFALVGGLILNLMPCVFPVLSLKAFSFMTGGARSQAHRRIEGWSYTAGILVSFGVIVALLVALRAGGSAIGWGFQLQEPLFVAAMILIMVVVGLSLSGLINIQTGLEGSGQSLTAQEGPKGAFFTGVLATLVATPCTAPFMAPAIGYALTQPAYVIFVVFFMLGFGLALPFLALAYSPALARMLPRPGAWMETFKQALAFPMYLTAVWLMSVLMTQAGPLSVIIILGALVFFTFFVWLFQKTEKKVFRAIIGMFALLTVLETAEMIEGQQSDAQNSGKGELASDAYSNERLNELVSAGEPVFAYFTADWCITCKVNERVALFRDETKTLFEQRGIKLLKGDWTNRNTEIANLLAKHGRAGVPLYLYFPKGAREPIILPEVLTISIIKEALDSAL